MLEFTWFFVPISFCMFLPLFPIVGIVMGRSFGVSTVVCGAVPNRWTHKRSTTAICTKKLLQKVVSAGNSVAAS